MFVSVYCCERKETPTWQSPDSHLVALTSLAVALVSCWRDQDLYFFFFFSPCFWDLRLSILLYTVSAASGLRASVRCWSLILSLLLPGPRLPLVLGWKASVSYRRCPLSSTFGWALGGPCRTSRREGQEGVLQIGSDSSSYGESSHPLLVSCLNAFEELVEFRENGEWGGKGIQKREDDRKGNTEKEMTTIKMMTVISVVILCY